MIQTYRSICYRNRIQEGHNATLLKVKRFHVLTMLLLGLGSHSWRYKRNNFLIKNEEMLSLKDFVKIFIIKKPRFKVLHPDRDLVLNYLDPPY
jgi:hypothetical protein